MSYALTFFLLIRQSNMLRLEARDNARNVKDEMERAFQALSDQVRRLICFMGFDCRWYILSASMTYVMCFICG